jgi:hypothetical protein
MTLPTERAVRAVSNVEVIRYGDRGGESQEGSA